MKTVWPTILTVVCPPRNRASMSVPTRSPIIFWLLLAATISVDAVVFSMKASERDFQQTYRGIIFPALVASELGVVCIWSVLSSIKVHWLAALFAPPVSAVVDTLILGPSPVINFVEMYLPLRSFYVAILLASLLLLRQTNYWQRRVGTSQALQYSLAQLLIAMSFTAVLIAMCRGIFIFDGHFNWHSFGFISSWAILAAASAIVWSRSDHWMLRLATISGFAILLSTLFWNTGIKLSGSGASFYIIQALVLSAWLAWGPILPNAVSASSATEEARQT
jgi:hypothetical protein